MSVRNSARSHWWMSRAGVPPTEMKVGSPLAALIIEFNNATGLDMNPHAQFSAQSIQTVCDFARTHNHSELADKIDRAWKLIAEAQRTHRA